MDPTRTGSEYVGVEVDGYEGVPLVAVALGKGPPHQPVLCCDSPCRFEIEFLSPQPPSLGKSQAVYALKAPDVANELSIAQLLRSSMLLGLPILPHLLTPRPPAALTAPGQPKGQAAARACAVAQRFALNPEQAAALQSVAGWGDASSQVGDSPPLFRLEASATYTMHTPSKI
jgi:hypothetical protein